jgi:copper(I)-binding protein
MRAFTPKAASAIGTATTFLTIRDLSDTPDELIAARSPIARHVVLTTRTGPDPNTGHRAVVVGLAVPADGTLTLAPSAATSFSRTRPRSRPPAPSRSS